MKNSQTRMIQKENLILAINRLSDDLAQIEPNLSFFVGYNCEQFLPEALKVNGSVVPDNFDAEPNKKELEALTILQAAINSAEFRKKLIKP